MSRTMQHHDYACEAENQNKDSIHLSLNPPENLAWDLYGTVCVVKVLRLSLMLWHVQAFKHIFLNWMQRHLSDNHQEEEEASLVQEIHLDQEEFITHPRLVFLFDDHSVKPLEVMMEEMDQEEMGIMGRVHQLMSPRLGNDLVVLAFRLLMETILETDFGVSLVSLPAEAAKWNILQTHCDSLEQNVFFGAPQSKPMTRTRQIHGATQRERRKNGKKKG